MQKIVIIGGGAVGSSTAYHLATHPRFAGEITVVERDPAYTKASSALSASGIRQQFSTPVNIAMSRFGLEFLKRAADVMAVDGDRPQLGLRESGYLFLASDAGLGALRDNHSVQRACGADVALLDPATLRLRFPWMSTDGIAAGSFGMTGEGWFNGPGLLQAFRTKARSVGVTYLAQDAVGFASRGERVCAVRLADGSALPCDIVVNAAGPWSARVACWLGIDLPVRARKRMVFVFDCRTKLPDCPLIIDATGVWVRPEGTGFICGRSPGEGEPDPDEPPLEVDEAMFHEQVWPVIAARVPAFEALKLTGSWAGYYELNVLDANGVIGPHPTVPNVIFATGFSGHGIQHSPATGRGVAELIVDGGFTTLDLSPLGFARVVEGRKLIERNVV
jgi:glycine/D-amino acid oxidase-like deaminating enzyme